jgi:hypothetical protein
MLESMSVLEMIVGKLDESKVAELTMFLPANRGLKLSIVFNKDDVAQHIAKFYLVDLKVALMTNLEDENPKSLYKYIFPEDEKQFPNRKLSRVEAYDEASRAFVEKLLLWINQVSPVSAYEDIEKVIAEHEATPFPLI